MVRESTRCFALPALLLLCGAGLAEIIDRIAISAGKQVITEAQIDEEVRLNAFIDVAELKLGAAERKAAAGRLIEQALVKREMDLSRYPLPDLADADPALTGLKARYADDAKYRQELQAYGITEDSLKRRLWWQLTVLRFIDYRFRTGIQIPDAELQQYYQQQVVKWRQQGIAPIPSLEDARYQMQEILTQQRIDQALDAWLADARTQLVIRFHDEALQ
jgi:peptidyl-prolyl cis-trans isomerase SurA